jgi:hypothetical protein
MANQDPHYVARAIYLNKDDPGSREIQLFRSPEEATSSNVAPESGQECIISPKNPILKISVVCATFKLFAERVRLRDFMVAKQEYRELRLYALEDNLENFAGAVCIHDPSVDPDYTWDQLIGPFELIAILRAGYDKGENPPPPDDSDLRTEGWGSKSNQSKPLEKDIRDEHHAWLRSLSDAFPSLSTDDRYFFTSPQKRFYNEGKPWSIYNVLVIQQRGKHYNRIGVGRCFAKAFWRNGAARKEISLA